MFTVRVAASVVGLMLVACKPGEVGAGGAKEKHTNGLVVAYDGGFWEIAPYSEGFVLKQKGSLRSPRAATLVWAREGRVEQRIDTQPAAGSGGQMHSIQAGKTCKGGGFVRLNASYQSEDAAPDFNRELKLLNDALCPAD